ncbi:hypothetical protein ABMA27_013656 [Loxostege sticticalis]|uniref:receptor protein-tyrosine kinase n=1 Tax=Loxostege sticticalis TaxID=481309 RepID=A0ABR3IG21_LOXSC
MYLWRERYRNLMALVMQVAVLAAVAEGEPLSACDALHQKYADGRVESYVSVDGRAHELHVYSDARAPSRAAAALLAVGLRSRLRYHVVLHSAPEPSLCRLAARLETHTHDTTLPRLVLIPSSVWEDGCVALTQRASEAPPRLRVGGAGAAPARLRLHAHLARRAAELPLCPLQRFVSKFGWTRLAVLSEDSHLATALVGSLRATDAFVVHNVTIDRSPNAALRGLLKSKARIIFVNSNSSLAWSVLCAARDLRMTPEAGYVWILREWYVTDNVTCRREPLSWKHFTISFWWRGGNLSYQFNSSSVKNTLDAKFGDSWPLRAAPMVDALYLLLRGFQIFLNNNPRRRYDFQGGNATRLFWENLGDQPFEGVTQTLKLDRYGIKNPLIYIDIWYGNRREPQAVWQRAFFRDLLGYLRARRGLAAGAAVGAVGEAEHAGAAALTRLARQAAAALEYLRAQGVVHRDVRAANCLVDARRALKLADFGLARRTAAGGEYWCRRHGLLPVPWMAPESLERGVYSASSDVWGLGVLLLELVTLGEPPYGAWPPERVLRHVCAGGRPPLPADVTPGT